MRDFNNGNLRRLKIYRQQPDRKEIGDEFQVASIAAFSNG